VNVPFFYIEKLIKQKKIKLKACMFSLITLFILRYLKRGTTNHPRGVSKASRREMNIYIDSSYLNSYSHYIRNRFTLNGLSLLIISEFLSAPVDVPKDFLKLQSLLAESFMTEFSIITLHEIFTSEHFEESAFFKVLNLIISYSSYSLRFGTLDFLGPSGNFGF